MLCSTGEIISEANFIRRFFFLLYIRIKYMYVRVQTKEPDRHVTLRRVQTLINPKPYISTDELEINVSTLSAK